jgi:metallo-beta-lactamase family protein
LNRLGIAPGKENHKFVSMKVKFCGAAQTVTGSSHLVTTDRGTKVLLHCGLYQGNDPDFY